MSQPIKPVRTIAVRSELGESPAWDWRRKTLLWTDINNRKLHEYSYESERHTVFETPERLCAFGLSRSPDWLVCAFESGFAWFRPKDGALHWLHRPERGNTGRRFNDGRMDSAGRFWCGTLVENNNADEGSGSLYVLEGSTVRKVIDSSFQIFNGCCWSPDDKWFFCADSAKSTIYRAKYDAARGSVGPLESIVETSNECPDGAVTDTSGALWSAHWGGHRVCQYSIDGHLDFILDVPARQPTCVTFLGEELNVIAVTSASKGLSLKADDSDGFTFLFEVHAQGTLAPLFAADSP